MIQFGLFEVAPPFFSLYIPAPTVPLWLTTAEIRQPIRLQVSLCAQCVFFFFSMPIQLYVRSWLLLCCITAIFFSVYPPFLSSVFFFLLNSQLFLCLIQLLLFSTFLLLLNWFSIKLPSRSLVSALTPLLSSSPLFPPPFNYLISFHVFLKNMYIFKWPWHVAAT